MVSRSDVSIWRCTSCGVRWTGSPA
ncbi:hypothetical protein [Delftia acidovorans]